MHDSASFLEAGCLGSWGLEPSDPDVGTGLLGKVSTGNSDGEFLDDGILDGHKNAHDDRKEHHYEHQNAMDNLFFNNFEPPNLSA